MFVPKTDGLNMGSNYFGKLFRMTTFGESHGEAIGVVIDGCPAGLNISENEITEALYYRSPGRNSFTSSRVEEDRAEIISGAFEGKTTGTPICIIIKNKDADSSQYEEIKNLYRPGHANFTYLEKYGIFDYRGGGRASARETAARVAAGAVAKKLLAHYGIKCLAYIDEIGGVSIPNVDRSNLEELRKNTYASPLFCPCKISEQKMIERIQKIKEQNDSLGGVVAGLAHLPSGLGDPVYCKLEASLAFAMLSIPASKGFEIGQGFTSARMLGSEHNDAFDIENGRVSTATNFSGGTLGGISTGSPLYFRVAFKPASSIKKEQQTVSLKGDKAVFKIPEKGRHDPCIAIRAAPVVDAMTALVLADAVLMNLLSTTK